MERGRERTRSSGRGWARYVWVGALVAVAGAGAMLVWKSAGDRVEATGPVIAPAKGRSADAPEPAIRPRRETRPTLDPGRFVGKAAVAHQVAREIPGVLDHLYCYCECDKHMGHKSLLSCYTDGHAAT